MLFSFIIGLRISPLALLTLVTPILVGVFYSVKLSRSMPRLKEIVGAKSVSVAFSWALYGSFLPLSLHQAEFEKTILIFTYIFVQLLVNTVLFDVLDVKGDSDSGIKSIPVVLGRSRTAKLLTIANSALCFWLAYSVFRGLFLNYLPALFFGVAYGYVIIWVFSSKGRQRLQAELMIDGEWLPIVAFMKIVIR
jgi:4-hydroxybenzoate polyprenyltransferase